MTPDGPASASATWHVVFHIAPGGPYDGLDGTRRMDVSELLFEAIEGLALGSAQIFTVPLDATLDLTQQTALTRTAVDAMLATVGDASTGTLEAGPPLGGMYYELVDGMRKCKGHFQVWENGAAMTRTVPSPAGDVTAEIGIAVSMDI